jgi:2-polyprenyl-3-methyl-5-hydroxy-6-metoxy-1,4-benzoquinol methylase
MDEFAQVPEKFLRRQMQKRHLAAVWAGLAGLRAGMCVLDIGSGPGILAAEYAAMVDAGVVYALEPRFPLHITRPNLILVRQDAEQKIVLPVVPDVVFLTDVLHHAAEPAAILRAVRAVCGEKTRVLVTEYDPDGPGLLGAAKTRRMGKAAVRLLLMAAGFAADEAVDSVDEHFAVLAVPA